jgi:hypothetical protein
MLTFVRMYFSELKARVVALWYSPTEPAEIMSSVCALAFALVSFLSPAFGVTTGLNPAFSGALAMVVFLVHTSRLVWLVDEPAYHLPTLLVGFVYWISLGIFFLMQGHVMAWFYIPLAQSMLWAYLRTRAGNGLS